MTIVLIPKSGLDRPLCRRGRDPGRPCTRNAFRTRRVTWKDLLARARIFWTRIDFSERLDLRSRQAFVAFRALAREDRRIETADSRIFDESIFHSVQRVTSRERGILNRRKFGGLNGAGGVLQKRLLIPYESRKKMRPVVRGRSRDDSVKVFRITLSFHQGLAASVGAADKVGKRRIPAVKSADDAPGLQVGLVHRTMPEVDEFLRMSDRPARAGNATLVTIVGSGRRVSAPERVDHRLIWNIASPAAVSFLPVFSVPRRCREP